MSSSNLKLGTVISITVDGVWAGSGNLVNGIIENCGAQFCDDNDLSLEVYEKIEDAILHDCDHITLLIGGEIKQIAWTIVEPS